MVVFGCFGPVFNGFKGFRWFLGVEFAYFDALIGDFFCFQRFDCSCDGFLAAWWVQKNGKTSASMRRKCDSAMTKMDAGGWKFGKIWGIRSVPGFWRGMAFFFSIFRSRKTIKEGFFGVLAANDSAQVE